MKRSLLTIPLAGALLLTGCSGATEAASTPEATVESPTPSAAPDPDAGKKLNAAFSESGCEPETDQSFEFASYVGTCGISMLAFEFNKDVIDSSISKEDALQEFYDANEEKITGEVWWVTDDWAAIPTGESGDYDISDVHPKAELYVANMRPSRVKDQEKAIKGLIEETGGVKCDDKGSVDGMEYLSFGCKKKNGEYYAIVGFYVTSSGIDYAMVDPEKMFTFANRDTYIARNKRWIMFDVPEEDAGYLAAQIDGDKENLNDNGD